VAIDSIEVDGPALRVAAAGAQRMVVYADLTRKVAVSEGAEIEFDAATVKHTYVRVECLGAGGRCAWTQPFFVRGGLGEALGRLLDERPALEVVRVPKLPGSGAAIDRGAWARTSPSRRFLSLATAEEARAQTDVRALTDGRSLMLAVLCDEPRMDAVRARVREQGDPLAWTDDSVQILLDAEGKSAWLWQLTVNSLGVLHSYRTDGPGELRRCRTWAGAFPGGWRVDVRIPLADLGVPRALATCRFNIGRNRYAESEVSTWKWVGDAFRTPRHFGLLRVKG
jgi:hypothetical protein